MMRRISFGLKVNSENQTFYNLETGGNEMNNTKRSFYGTLRSKRGMTLVEVLVALTLLTLIILVFTPLFMNYYRMTRTAGEITQKTYHRASIMERLVANRGGNESGYEFDMIGIPLTLTSKQTPSVTATFSSTGANNISVDGNTIVETASSSNAYVTFYAKSTSTSMTCFPASITDDFLTKDITVVPSGFKFDDTAFANDGQGSTYHFEVFNTNDDGTLSKVNFSEGFYTIKKEVDTDSKAIAIFTFKGGNNTISFEHSPLIIKYCSGTATVEYVKVEINAPEIILVGEAAEDKTTHEKNYYYYATYGVDVDTGRMDIVAKKMTGDASLVSAMNDVEWVAKGEGDNGNGGINEYGYYVMGGDAGQVRRFWRNSVGNYYWGGDYLYNYDSYAYYTDSSGVASGSYENFSKSSAPITQASFKKIVRANQAQNTTNSVSVNTIFDSSKFSLTGADWKAITSNYFTANITSADQDKFYVTLGRVLNVGWSGGGTTGRSGMDYGATAAENDNLRTWLTYNTDTGKHFTVDGYKSAADYDYAGQTDDYGNTAFNDNSLITITSVGAIQIDSGTRKIQENSSLKNSVYPTQSYTLYCGYIPAVVDLWGYTNHGNFNSNWVHEATLGVATDGDEWYPTGKFGDRYATTTSLNEDLFANAQTSAVIAGQTRTVLNYGDLLNFRVPDTDEFNTDYPANYDGGGQEPYIVHHDAVTHIEGKYTHKITVKGTYTSNYRKNIFSSYQQRDFSNLEITITTKGTPYDEYYSSIQQLVVDAINAQPGIGSYTFRNSLNITEIQSSTIDGASDPNYPGNYHVYGQGSWQGVFDAADNNLKWTSVEDNYRDEVVETPAWDETKYKDVAKTDAIWYYGPNASLVTDTMSGHTHKTETAGTALPYLNNYYYMTDAREVDITLGYLSYPYAIGIQTPGVPQISGTNGSDYYFSCYGHGSVLDTNSKYDHSFFSGGLRDNVTLLDIKSFRDALTGNTFSLGVGYTLSYLFGDGKTGSGLSVKHTTYLSQVYNTGIVYLRGTGNDSSNSDGPDQMASGKGWSLGYASNVFHQFYGTDQYRDKSGLITNENNNGPLGWDTSYHRAYFNISIREDTPPNADTAPGRTTYGTSYGINCHPLQATECTTVNWGLTYDDKPQAMWGTANGTLLSWSKDYETPTNSKITSVKKEFESYQWADRYGNSWTSNKNQFYGYFSDSSLYSDYGFISVLSSINDVCCSDNIWIAVGNQSGKAPEDYCASKYNCCVSSVDCTSGLGTAGSYVNVKQIKEVNNTRVSVWKAVKVSDAKNVNFLSVVNCQGVWYLMGYIDADGDGKNDANEQSVMYWSIRPEEGFRRCYTRLGEGTANSDYSNTDTYAVYYDGDDFHALELDGINKMASQG